MNDLRKGLANDLGKKQAKVDFNELFGQMAELSPGRGCQGKQGISATVIPFARHES